MTFDPGKHHRRSIRLEDYDYSWAGAYFVTICAQNRSCLFGEICNDEVIPNPAGRLVQSEWDALPKRFSLLDLDAFVLMPNHVHAIVVITEESWTSPTADQFGCARGVRNPNVGATLVVAQSADDRARAGTRPAPTLGAQNPNVGATLVVAQSADTGAPVDDKAGSRPEDRAGSRPEDRAGSRPEDRAGSRPQGRAGTRPAPTLGDVVGAFKSLTTHRYVIGVRNHGWPRFQRRLWQRNYDEHIIRNAGELKQVRQYIADNPVQWVVDRENPDRSVGDTAGKPDELDDIARLFGGVRP